MKTPSKDSLSTAAYWLSEIDRNAEDFPVERRREEYMIVQIARRMVAPQLAGLAENGQAARWAAVETLEDVRRAALDLDLDFWAEAAAILGEAILLGNHEPAPEITIAAERMERAKELAR